MQPSDSCDHYLKILRILGIGRLTRADGIAVVNVSLIISTAAYHCYCQSVFVAKRAISG